MEHDAVEIFIAGGKKVIKSTLGDITGGSDLFHIQMAKPSLF